MHRSTQKITESVPGKKVVWTVSDSYLSFIKDKTEWNGTKVIFDISQKDGKTEVRFTHRGLSAKQECFDACTNTVHREPFSLFEGLGNNSHLTARNKMNTVGTPQRIFTFSREWVLSAKDRSLVFISVGLQLVIGFLYLPVYNLALKLPVIAANVALVAHFRSAYGFAADMAKII